MKQAAHRTHMTRLKTYEEISSNRRQDHSFAVQHSLDMIEPFQAETPQTSFYFH